MHYWLSISSLCQVHHIERGGWNFFDFQDKLDFFFIFGSDVDCFEGLAVGIDSSDSQSLLLLVELLFYTTSSPVFLPTSLLLSSFDSKSDKFSELVSLTYHQHH